MKIIKREVEGLFSRPYSGSVGQLNVTAASRIKSSNATTGLISSSRSIVNEEIDPHMLGLPGVQDVNPTTCDLESA